jgi:Thioredoxin like C-terminal domain
MERSRQRRESISLARKQRGSIGDRTFEITFDAPGVEAYAFTFG